MKSYKIKHLKKPLVLAVICLILIVLISIIFNFFFSFFQNAPLIGNYLSVLAGWFIGQIYSNQTNKKIDKKIQNKIVFYCFIAIFIYGQGYGLKNFNNKIMWTLVNIFFTSLYCGVLYLFIGKGSHDYFKFTKQTKLANKKKG